MVRRAKGKATRPRIQDVARVAGVSPMTVSRALRGLDSVLPETRKRVEEAVRTIGYIPDQAAGALRAGSGNLVAAIVPSLRNSIFSETLQGLADAISPHGLFLSVADGQRSQDEELLLIRSFLALRPCGLVLQETRHSTATRRLLKGTGIPVVEVGDLVRSPIDMAISFSNREAASRMVRYLLGRGYRRIGLMTLPFHSSERSHSRYLGYRDALAEAGVAVSEDLVIQAPGGFAEGAACLNRLMRCSPRPDAIFGASDVLAVGALLAAQAGGLRVPDDVAIASFDRHEISDAIVPKLTSLDVPRYRIGHLAGQAIVARNNGEAPARLSAVDCPLLPGQTT